MGPYIRFCVIHLLSAFVIPAFPHVCYLLVLLRLADEVMVTGVLYSKWRSPVQDVRCDLELMFQANYIKQVFLFLHLALE